MDRFSIVKKAIDNADPYGLPACRYTSDEYDIESEKIADAVSETDTADKMAAYEWLKEILD